MFGVYAVFGIPLFMVMLAGLGSQINYNVQKAVESLQWARKYRKRTKALKIAIILVVGNICFITLPAIGFSAMENWSFNEALYFIIATLTTVGFGDMVVGTLHDK